MCAFVQSYHEFSASMDSVVLYTGFSICYWINSHILYQSINQSINQLMALSASCVGHTRTQSHAALYKINNEVYST